MATMARDSKLAYSNRTAPLTTREGSHVRSKPISRAIARELPDDDDQDIWTP